MKEIIVYNGVEYTSIVKLAKVVGILSTTLYQRINKGGMTIEQALSIPYKKCSTPVEYNGVKYNSISELSRATGVAYTLLRDRITKSGMTPEEAVNAPVREFGIDYAGVHYNSVRELAEVVGVELSTLQNRLASGISIDDAVSMPKSVSPKHKIEYNGVEYYSRHDLCVKLGISYAAVSNRMSKGQTLEEAVEAVFHPASKSTAKVEDKVSKNLRSCIEYNSIMYDSLSALARSLDISIVKLKYRIKKGMSLEEAIVDIKNSGFDFDGKHYNTISDLARVVGLPANWLQTKVREGLTIEDVITMGKNHNIRSSVHYKLTYDDVDYDSLQQLAEALNVCRDTIRYRLNKGMSAEEAIADIKKSWVVYNGVEYRGLTALAKSEGVSIYSLSHGLEAGLSLEDAVKIAKEFRLRCKEVTYNGVVYPSLRTLCSRLDIDYRILISRMHSGWGLEQAIETPVKDSDTSVEYNGVVYSGMTALAEAVGMSVATLNSRLRRGWSIEMAVETPLISKTEIRGKVVIYGDKTYSSIAELCRELGVDKGLVHSRMSDGWTLEEALETPRIINVSSCIKSSPDIARASMLLKGKYFVITCAVCGRRVLLPLEEANKFVHSDNCKRNEWL